MSPNQLLLNNDVVNSQAGNCQLGDLYDSGYVQHQNLGYFLKKKYDSLFKRANLTTYFRSSFNQRTLGSIKGVLDVLYPDSLEHEVHVADEKLESMELHGCPFYDDWLKYTRNIPIVLQNEPALLKIKQLLNYHPDDQFDWWMAYDYLESREFQRMSSAHVLAHTQLIQDVEQQLWAAIYCNPQQELHHHFMRAAAGPFLRDLQLQMSSKKEFVLFSAHQETLGPLLAIFTGKKECRVPEFAAMLEIRVYDSQIEIDYQGKELVKMEKQKFEALLAEFGAGDEEQKELCKKKI